MKRLPSMSVPLAVSLALLSGASAAQDRPNTTLVQKSKAGPTSAVKAKSAAQTPAQLSGASDGGTAKRSSPGAAPAAPAAAEMQNDCQHGKAADA